MRLIKAERDSCAVHEIAVGQQLAPDRDQVGIATLNDLIREFGRHNEADRHRCDLRLGSDLVGIGREITWRGTPVGKARASRHASRGTVN
jgi:hypothetical protein